MTSIKAMGTANTDVNKHREICFRGPHPDLNQAQTATLILSDVEGILQVHPHGTQMIMVTYDVSLITLQIIEEFLSELGFHLDNSLLMKLRRAFYYYAEDLQQDVMGCRRGRGNCTQDVFINRYRQLEHGCRDLRPDHWRQYH